MLIQNEERETSERLAADEIRRKQDASDLEIRKAKDAKEAIKLEKLRDAKLKNFGKAMSHEVEDSS